jgi:gliding motility-associated-like protein
VKDTDKNPFDDSIRERLEQFEMPYDSAAWSRFEQHLPKTSPPADQGLSGIARVGVGMAVVALIAAVAYIWPLQPVEQASELVSKQPNEGTTSDNRETEEPSVPSIAQPLTESASESRTTPHSEQEPKKTETVGHPIAQESMGVGENPSRQMPLANSTRTEDGKTAEPKETTPAPTTNHEYFHLKMAVSKTKVCVGDEVSFMAISDAAGIHYEWVFGDGERSTRDQAAKTFLSPGTYEVLLSGMRGEAVAERTETITVYPAPSAMFVMERPIVGIPLYELSTSLQTGERSIWEFSDGRTDTKLETRQLFRSRGSASAKLTVTNEHGCSSSREQTVRIDEDFRLFAETGFTPNGDGINDHFLPKALEVMDMPFEMTVRDAFGREVFRTSNINEPWNGRELNTGVTLPRGTYLWTVVLTEPILKNPVFTGNITIQ